MIFITCRTLCRLLVLSRMRRSRRPGSNRERRRPCPRFLDFSLTASEPVSFSMVEADATYQVKVEGEEEIALIESVVEDEENPLTAAFR